MQLQEIPLAALDSFDGVIITDLVAGAALNALDLPDAVKLLRITGYSVGWTTRRAQMAAITGFTDRVRDEGAADTGRTSVVGDVGEIFIAEVPHR